MVRDEKGNVIPSHTHKVMFRYASKLYVDATSLKEAEVKAAAILDSEPYADWEITDIEDMVLADSK